MTLIFEHDLGNVKLNRQAKRLSRVVQKFSAGHTHTHTHTQLTVCSAWTINGG